MHAPPMIAPVPRKPSRVLSLMLLCGLSSSVKKRAFEFRAWSSRTLHKAFVSCESKSCISARRT
eukprot:3978846-Prymnesium_polylepis.1